MLDNGHEAQDLFWNILGKGKGVNLVIGGLLTGGPVSVVGYSLGDLMVKMDVGDKPGKALS